MSPKTTPIAPSISAGNECRPGSGMAAGAAALGWVIVAMRGRWPRTA